MTQGGNANLLLIIFRKALKTNADVQVMMDTKDVINTIGSFSVQAHSLRPIFIPIHSHGSAGHCVLSFKSKSKELEKLFKIRISVKVNNYWCIRDTFSLTELGRPFVQLAIFGKNV